MDYLWSLSDAPRHARERIIPSGTIELVINLHEDEFRIYGQGAHSESCRRFPGAIVSGCYRTPFEIDTREHASVVGVHFMPGGLVHLLGVPPGEIADLHVALEDLWGRRASELLREQLSFARDARQRLQIMERALCARVAHGRCARPAARAALPDLDRPDIEIGDVAKKLNLSRRRFIEIFTEDVGMTPKRYARVRRLQRALALVTDGRTRGWAQLALQCGYFDQAHLCRDWVELTGLSPTAFVALRETHVKDNHVALPGEGSNSSNTPPQSASSLGSKGGGPCTEERMQGAQ